VSSNRALFVFSAGFSLLCLVIFGVILHHAFKAQAQQKSSDAVSQALPDLIQTTNLIKEDAFPVQLPVADTRPEGLIESYRLLADGKQAAALDKITALIQTNPEEKRAYLLRGSIYCDKKLWDQATQDYKKAQELDGKDPIMQFNLVEIDFKQKKYDAARTGFVALQKDAKLGDLASYKIFLCDLLGGHEDQAFRELDAFNYTGSNPSYYYIESAFKEARPHRAVTNVG
jgi:tetratricopeptide (TPR) repeat protein